MVGIEGGVVNRTGSYEIGIVAKGGMPLPSGPLAGSELTAYWAGLIDWWLDKQGIRKSATDGMLAGSHSALLHRYSLKIDIKSIEAVMALAHRILVPGEKVLCAYRCLHVAKGMTAVQAKEFIDSLDAAIEELTTRIRGTSHWTDEDLEDERDIYRGGGERFMEVLRAAKLTLPMLK